MPAYEFEQFSRALRGKRVQQQIMPGMTDLGIRYFVNSYRRLCKKTGPLQEETSIRTTNS